MWDVIWRFYDCNITSSTTAEVSHTLLHVFHKKKKKEKKKQTKKKKSLTCLIIELSLYT